MRLDFKILWFEDQFRELASQLEEIKDHVSEAGFQPDIVQQLDGAKIDDLVQQQQLYHEFELVVVDLNLAGEWLGDEVAARIRSGFSFTDVLFYSGDGEAKLRRLIGDKGVDGVYCCDRNDIVSRVIERVDFVCGSLDRLESMRGLAASVVGQCDRLLIECIAAHEGNGKAPDELAVLLDRLVSASRDYAKKRYDSCVDVPTRLESRSVTSHVLWQAIREIVPKDGPFAAERSTLGSYDDQVLKKRNTLSHAVEEPGPDGWEISDAKGGTFTRDDYPSFRRDLSAHLANFRALHNRIKTNVVDE
ncbi:MAG: hypothetical protein AAF234_13515 [Pseudomonadota bacterium]